MQHIIEGFLSFQKEIFPQRKELFRSLASLNWSPSKSRDNSLLFVMLATLFHRSGRSQAASLQLSSTR